MSTSDDDMLRSQIAAEAERYADANVYNLQNRYLSDKQKAFVECWFQSPLSLFSLTLLAGEAIYPQVNLLNHILAACAVGAFSAVFFLVLPIYRFILVIGFLTCGPLRSLWIALSAVYFGIQGKWGWLAYAAVAFYGLDSFISPGLWIYTIFGRQASGQRMHCKYAIAKRVFGIAYPFERE